MRSVVRLGLTLMLVCAVAGVCLAAVYAKTKPIIDERAQEDLMAAVTAAIPGAQEIREEVSDGHTYWVGYDGDQIRGAAISVSSPGFREPIELMVGFRADGVVASVNVVSNTDTPGIGSRVSERSFLDRFVGVENPNAIDSVSGATVSSSSVKASVAKAIDVLGSILGEPEVPIEITSIADGTYVGEAEGFHGLIKVSVTIGSGKIAEVKITYQEETPGTATPALSGIPKAIVAEQSLSVDAVTGATFTSKAVVQAVKNALKEAPAR